MIDKADLIKMIRENITPAFIDEMLSVQPISPNIFKNLLDSASRMSEDEMLDAGYKPVSSHKLLWIKDNEIT